MFYFLIRHVCWKYSYVYNTAYIRKSVKSNEMLKLKNVFKPPILNQIAVQGYQIKENFKSVWMEVSELMHTGRKIRYFDKKRR